MLGFVALAVVAAVIALSVRPPRVLRLLERSMHSSTQLPVVLSVLLIATFVSLSQAIGLESVLGAFAAGMVVGLASQGGGGKVFRLKVEAICFGFLVPFFFVVSGMHLEVGLLVKDPEKLLLVPVFLLLFFIVRGTPVVLYRHDIAKSERLPFVLFSATALPIVVAITDIGVRTGRLLPEIAAALVGAGLLSVLLFPAVAIALLPRRSLKEP
jgi:Kef-type K+ transport system membrane component KefB